MSSPITLIVDCGNDPNASESYVTEMFERMICDRSGGLIHTIETIERGCIEKDNYSVYKILFSYAPYDLKKMCEEIAEKDGVIEWSYVLTGKTSNLYTWKIAEVKE
jgi:hypothetical protein